MKKLLKQDPRALLAGLMRRFYEQDLNTSRGGNISLRATNGWWCTPSALDKAHMEPEDMMFLRDDGVVFGRHDVSIETYIHMNIQKRCAGRNAVVHVHDLPAVEFSVMHRAPRTDLYPTCLLGCEIPVTPFAVPGTQELADTLVEAFNRTGSPCAILANHGMFIGESDLFRAVETLEAVDFLCRTERGAAALGALRPMPRNAREILNRYRTRKLAVREDLREDDEILAVKRRLCALSRRAYRRRLFSINMGTFAARAGKGGFVITADGADRGNLDPEDLVYICEGALQPGAGQPLHADFCQRIFDAYPEIQVITIAQPASAMIFACADVPFESKVLPESFSKLRSVHYVPFGGLYLESEDALKNFDPARGPITIVENECIVCTSDRIFNAFECCELVDEYARIQMHIRQMDARAIPLSDEQLRVVLDGEAHKAETDLARYSVRRPF